MMKMSRKVLIELVLNINKKNILGSQSTYGLLSSKYDLDNQVGHVMATLSVNDFNELEKELRCYRDA